MATLKRDKIGIERLKTGWVIRITIRGIEYKIGRCKSKKLCQILRDMIIEKLNLKSATVYREHHFNEDQTEFMTHHSREEFLRMVTEKTYIKFYNKFVRSRKKARREKQAMDVGVSAATTLPNSMDVAPLEVKAATIAAAAATAAEAASAAAAATATAAQEAKLAAKAAKRAAKVAKRAADAAQAAFRAVAACELIDNARIDAFGVGLKNKESENNCFLNVVVQSLWHLSSFKHEFLKSFLHKHTGVLCVTCALYEVFAGLSKPFDKGQKKAVDPNVLRKTLSNLDADIYSFQEGEMNDASEALEALLKCLHESSTSDCANNTCIAHSSFGFDVSIPMICQYCGFNGGPLEFTSFVNYVNAKLVREAKVGCADGAFDKVLKIAGMTEFSCDGCGNKSYNHRTISKPPRTFITVLGWQNSSESANDISATLASITTEIDIGLIFEGLREGSKHSLVSVMHYMCFAYEHGYWVMYNDEIVEIIGGWDDMISLCKRKILQPHILFFEAISV